MLTRNQPENNQSIQFQPAILYMSLIYSNALENTFFKQDLVNLPGGAQFLHNRKSCKTASDQDHIVTPITATRVRQISSKSPEI